MSGTGGGANLPIKIGPLDTADMQRAVRELGESFQAQVAQNIQPAVQRVSETFNVLEGRAQGARRAMSDLRGAMELLGAGGVSGALAPLTSQVGNLADAFSTVSLAARSGGTILGTMVPAIAGVTAAVTAGIAIWQNWDAIVGGTGRALQDVGEQLGVLPQRARLTDGALESSTRLMQAFREQTTLAAQSVEALARQRANAFLRNQDLEFVSLQRERGQRERSLREQREPLTRAEQALAAFDANPPLLGAAFERRGLVAEVERRQREFQQNAAGLQQQLARYDEQLRELELARTRALNQPEIFLRPGELPTAVERTVTAPAGGGRAEDPEADFLRAEDRARRAAETALREGQRANERLIAEERRALDQRERENERATDNITRYLADGFSDAFASGTGGFNRMLAAFQQAAINTPIRIVAEALIRPVASGAVSALGLGGGEGTAALSQLLGFSGLSGQVGDLLGLGGAGGLGGLAGLGASLNGLAASALPSVFTSTGFANLANPASLAATTPEALLAALPAGPGAAAGGVSLTGLIGGAGAGFAVGSFTAGLTARSSAQRTNGQIGAGLGSLAGFAIGGPIGGLIGGAIGGAAGGLIGPSSSFSGGDALIGVGSDGLLRVSGTAGKRFDAAALTADAQRQIDSLNQALLGAGLRFDSGLSANNWVAALGGGQSGNPRDILGALSRFGVNQLRATDANGQAVLDRVGTGDIQALIAAISQDRADRSAREARESAERAAREAQRDSARSSATDVLTGLTDYARSLRTANDNSGTPLSRFEAAQRDFQAALGGASGGDFRSLARLQSSAESFRGLARDIYGTGTGFADAEAQIIRALEQVGVMGEDRLTASALAAVSETQTVRLETAISLLQQEVAGLRRDAAQRGLNPLVA